MASDRSASGTMLTWLKNDLSKKGRPWLIALWHHSPYSKGDHDSDIETEMAQMRQNANKILEDHGVDLVIGAHSNDYERSFLIDGSYGLSNTFSSNNVKNGGSGKADAGGEYKKPAGTAHAGTVYAVNGSAAYTGGGLLNHPAMYVSLNQVGSMVLDLNCTKLDVKFLRDDGTVGDYFTIRKTDIAPAPAMTAPANGATFAAGSNITLSASVVDPDTKIKQVRFFQNGTAIARDSSSPYSIIWSNVKAGTYNLTAEATDQLCVTAMSPAITITVK